MQCLKNPFILFVFLVLLFGIVTPGFADNGSFRQKNLAHKLSRDTLLYIQLDVEKALQSVGDYFKFVNKVSGNAIIKEVKTLKTLLVSFAKIYQFQPILFDKIHKTRCYFIMDYMDKPLVTIQKYKQYQYNQTTKKYGMIEKERRIVEKINYIGVLETDIESAKNLIPELKSLVERMKEKHPAAKKFTWKQIDMDKGELVKIGDIYLGRLGKYLTLSQFKPKKLWRYLQFPADQSLSETDLYNKYQNNPLPSQAMVLFNLGKYLKGLEKEMKEKIEEAKRDARKERKPSPWKVNYAESNLRSYQIFKKLFSFDKLKFVGANLAWGIRNNLLQASHTISLSHSEPISPFLKSILNGGQTFQDPGLGLNKYLAFLFRLELKNMRKTLLKSMDQKAIAQSEMANRMVKVQMGYSIDEILSAFSGDLYFFFREKNRGKEKSSEPEFITLLGLNDGVAFSEMLSKVVTKSVMTFGMGNYVKKRVYMRTNVYVIGNSKKPEFALVILGRYVSFGSWDTIKSLIRKEVRAREKLSDPRLLKVISKHRNSNLLLLVSKSYLKADLIDQKKRVQGLMSQAKRAIKTNDREMDEKIVKSLKNLFHHLMRIQEHSTSMSPDIIVFNGTHTRKNYEITTRFEMKK